MTDAPARIALVRRVEWRDTDAPASADEETPAAEAEMVGVHVSAQPGGRPEPWPEEIREALAAGGDQGRVEGA